MRSKVIPFLIFSLCLGQLRAQTPGGVGTNLSLWLKANNAPTVTGNPVSAWTTSGGSAAGFTVNQGTAGNRPALVPGSTNYIQYNYNPRIKFSAATGNILSNTATNPDLLGTNGTFFLLTDRDNSSGTAFGYYSNTNFRYQAKPGFRFQTGQNGQGWTFDFPLPTEYSQQAAAILTGHGLAGNMVMRVNSVQDNACANCNNATYFPSINAGLSVGANGSGEYSNNAIGEIILYRVKPSNAELDRIDSYLAVKYGITRGGNTGTAATYNYVATDGVTVTWDKTANAGYNRDIAGIGRDDATALNQKQSISVNYNEALTLALTAGIIPLDNVANTNTFTADKTFLIWGNNGATNTFNTANSKPISVRSRLNRIWKYQSTGFNQNLAFGFESTQITGYPALNRLCLIFDEDGVNWTNAQVVALGTAVMQVSASGSRIEFSNITLPAGKPYFTIGIDCQPMTMVTGTKAPTCPNVNDAKAYVTSVSGGGTPYTFSIDGGAFGTNDTFPNVAAGSHKIYVKDVAGCLDSTTITVSALSPISFSNTNTDVSCFGLTDGTASVSSIAGGTSPYTVDWSTAQNGLSITAGKGTYRAVIKDANGCKDSVDININEPTKLKLDTVVTPTSCPQVSKGKIVASASGGNTSFQYNRDNLAYTASGTFNNLAQGSYMIRVKDNKGCADSILVTVNAGDPPTVIASNDTAVCPGSMLKLEGSGTPAVTYVWTGGITNNSNFTVNAAKKYYLTGTDANGCKGTDSTDVTLLAVPNSTIQAPPSIICSDTTTIQLSSATPGGNWRGPGITDAVNGVFDPAVSGPGSFKVIYEVTTTCFDDDTTTVTVTSRKNAKITPAGPFCLNASAQQLVGAQTGGNWSGTGVSPSGVFSPTTAGQGIHTITYALGGTCPHSDQINITVNSFLDATINPSGPFCVTDAPVQLTAKDGGPLWTGPGITDGSLGTFDPGIAKPGTHTIKHEISGTCGSTDTEQFTVLPLDTVHILRPNDSICYNGSPMQLSADISGGTWSGNVNSSGLFDPTGKSPGVYKVYYTLALKCPYTDSSVIIIPDTFKVSVADNAVLCFGDQNATLVTQRSFGSAPFQYQWMDNPGLNQGNRNGLGLGTYKVSVTDALGCVAGDSAIITQPSQVQIPAASVAVTNDSCYQSAKGAVQLAATGGTPDPMGQYQFTILPSAQAVVGGFRGLSAGTYTITAKDANGCAATRQITVTEPTQLRTYASGINDHCAQKMGSVKEDSTSGGTQPYTWSWSNGVVGQVNNNINAGTYTLTATDAMKCTATRTVQIVNVAGPSVKLDSLWVSCFGFSDGGATSTVTGGTGAITYAWSDGQQVNQSSRNNFPAGTHWLDVTDSKNCKARDSVQVLQPNALKMVDIGSPHLLCYNTAFTGNFATSGGNTGVKTYYINGVSQPSSAYSFSNAASYSIFARDVKGCYSDTIRPQFTSNPDIAASLSANDSVCRFDTARFVASAQFGNGNFSYQFDSDSPSNLRNKAYPTSAATPNRTPIRLIVTDGCSKPDTVDGYYALFPDPTANLVYAPLNGCFPLDVNYQLSGNLTTFNIDAGDGTMSQSASFTQQFGTPGGYIPSVSGATARGCAFQKTFAQAIRVDGYPKAEFDWDPETPTVLQNQLKMFNYSEGATSYRWTLFADSAMLQEDLRSTAFEPLFEMLGNPGEYPVKLVAVTAYGCEDSIVKRVTLEDEFTMYIPTSFTPNEDGFNEVWGPVMGSLKTDKYELGIYNRWGQCIFLSTNPEDKWNGTYLSEPAQQDVYTFKLRYSVVGDADTKDLFGRINLLR